MIWVCTIYVHNILQLPLGTQSQRHCHSGPTHHSMTWYVRHLTAMGRALMLDVVVVSIPVCVGRG
ncbi:hypothetical protein E2C01_071362 [Portunus trituberculatus]|uniref:Uncharacterized protein n=1 Tax=Portunus trituberculatus TaxID=210409 RepID=A0A5B7I4A1_PORTR|nr:hypothetical protein [Portunus trituberculatus]